MKSELYPSGVQAKILYSFVVSPILLMQSACSRNSMITVTPNKANYIWTIQFDRPQQRSKVYGKLPTNNDHSLGLLPHHGCNAHGPEHNATKGRDLWSPSIARTWHEMGTILSWHKFDAAEAHTTTDGYNCVSWKQDSILLFIYIPTNCTKLSFL